MALVLPYEGRSFIARYLLRREIVDRDDDLRFGLLANTDGDLTLTLAGMVEPTGVGYERLPAEDLAWAVDPLGQASLPSIVFIAGPGGWSPYVQGYFICTNANGGTPRLIGYEFDNRQQLAAGTLNRLGANATCVTPQPHGLVNGGFANVRGAVQSEYNGVFPVSVTGSNSFTYTVPGSPASPATGVILVNRCFQMDVGSLYRVTPALSVGV